MERRIPDDFDLATWMAKNNALTAIVQDGVLVSIHPQAYNWHLTLSDDPCGYFDDY